MCEQDVFLMSVGLFKQILCNIAATKPLDCVGFVY